MDAPAPAVRTSRKRFLAFVAASSLLAGCYVGDVPEGCGEDVAPLRELSVVDDDTLASLEQEHASLRFGHTLARLTSNPAPNGAIEGWLADWHAHLPGESESRTLDESFTCRWLRVDERNGCNLDCSVCVSRRFERQAAPFRLLAVVYRPDLAEHVGQTNASAGEARLVYGASNLGARLGLIAEFPLPEDVDWARRFHALGTAPAEEFPSLLGALIEEATQNPEGARLRTLLESDAGSAVLHEFSSAEPGEALSAVPLRRVPRADVDPLTLSEFVRAHADEVLAGTHELPKGMRALYGNLGAPEPLLPGVEPELRDAFRQQTCNGCHRNVGSSRSRHFHIGPSASNENKLSTFLRRPGGELDRRALLLGDRLCE